jgi:hypothetical protein
MSERCSRIAQLLCRAEAQVRLHMPGGGRTCRRPALGVGCWEPTYLPDWLRRHAQAEKISRRFLARHPEQPPITV